MIPPRSRATLRFGCEEVVCEWTPANPPTVEEAFRANAEALCIDWDAMIRSRNQSMFSSPQSRNLVFRKVGMVEETTPRVRRTWRGRDIGLLDRLEDGGEYVATITLQCKGD